MKQRPFLRRGPSGPLALDFQPIVQIGFDQCIYTGAPDAFVLSQVPANTQEALTSYLPRNLTTAPPGPGGVAKTNRLAVTLEKVRADSLIAAWLSFSYITGDVPAIEAQTSLAVEDEAGAQALIGFATARNAIPIGGTGSGTTMAGSVQTLGPNPTGKEEDFTVYPVAWATADIVVIPQFNQVSLIVAEIAQSPSQS